jgi:two-component system, chemotaxis family, chemotaxis protein CheY
VSAPKRILAVDDEESIARIIQANLRRAGFEVDIAHNGADALALLLSRPYDLLISDVNMPQMDGLELLEHLRQDPEMAHLPVILLTAQSSGEAVSQGYSQGTDLYLTKPFVPEELVLWVQRTLAGLAPG